MKKALMAGFGLFAAVLLYAADGDTTIIRSHDKQHMKFPPSDRVYIKKAKFPDGSATYRKIFLDYTLGCPNTGCSTWDYDTHVALLQPTGTMDSTLTQFPYFKVDNTVPDSFYISVVPTYQTFYNTTTMQTDSVMSDTVYVDEFGNAASPSQVTASFYAFETGYYKYYFDAAGLKIDSIYENGDSIWYQQYYDVYNVFEVKNTIEIGRLITPYGEPANIDYYPYTYRFDITDYAPLLQDSVEVKLQFAGWQDGFLATLDFVFIEGMPPRDPKRVIHMHNGYFAYGNASNPINSNLAPLNVQLSGTETAAQLNYTVTGHGSDNSGCSEFCSKYYAVRVNGASKYSSTVWKDDCGMNPIFPQGGTWIYDRANWCPGLPGYTDHHDLTPYVNNSSPSEIKIEFQSHTTSGGSAPGYNINGHVITYDAANFSLDAELVKIVAPNDDWLESRRNPICGSPIVVIRNTGSTTLTSLKITYGPKGGTPMTYNWTGSLKFLEEAEVELPAPSWHRTENVFEASVSEPNGSVDEYASNNALAVSFDPPDFIPATFSINYFTNSRSSTENVLTITNTSGAEVYRKENPINNHLYQDTITLVKGCYEMKLTDGGGDGLSFFNSSQGNGSLFLRDAAGKSIKTFQKDFGSEISYRFTIDWPLGESLAEKPSELFVYPNPTEGLFYIDGLQSDIPISIELFDGTGKLVHPVLKEAGYQRMSMEVPDNLKGLLILRVVQNDKVDVIRIIRY